ncbi:MAG: DUF423 domain-containing protein [Gammaproteobacteria bacterium]|jgi:uncharacterized membrane protein YgdD (TMEM256/DUF423 family)
MSEISLTAKSFLLLGSANAMLAVIFGAFGAHALKARLDENLLRVFQTGVEYHFYHAFGLILIGILAINLGINGWIKTAGWMMFAGIILFSGSLYLLSILNLRWLGMITPIGGLLFILSWLSLSIAIFKN